MNIAINITFFPWTRPEIAWGSGHPKIASCGYKLSGRRGFYETEWKVAGHWGWGANRKQRNWGSMQMSEYVPQCVICVFLCSLVLLGAGFLFTDSISCGYNCA